MVENDPSLSDAGSETIPMKSPPGPRIITNTDFLPSFSTPTKAIDSSLV